MLFTEAAAEFELSISGGSHSQSTINIFRASLKSFQSTIDHSMALGDITITHLRQWQAGRNALVKAGESSAHTMHRYSRDLITFFNWCVEEGLLDTSPAARLPLPRLPKDELPANISDLDLMRLLDEAYKSGPRDYAILRFLANTGCRVSGLTSLRLGGLEFDMLRANVTEKGQKSRYVYFNLPTANAIRAYLVERSTKYDDHIFIGLRGPLTRSGISSLLKRLAKAGGVEGVYNPHSFRHAWARRALEQCRFDLGAVSHYLGHSRIDVTHQFYNRWSEIEWGDRIRERDTLEALEDKWSDEF